MSSSLPTDEALEKEDRIEEMKKEQNKKKKPTRPAPAASTAGPCPTICQSSRTPPVLEATQHHRPTQPPTKAVR